MPAKGGGKGRRHHRKHKQHRNGHVKDAQMPNGGPAEDDRRILRESLISVRFWDYGADTNG